MGYWLEIADDVDFQRMALTRWGLREPSFEVEGLNVGTYYWRVSALDKFGLPGARSDAWRFNVRVDRTPPFLMIKEPEEGTILRTSPAHLRGTAEQGVTLRMGGSAVPVAADGSFDVSAGPRGRRQQGDARGDGYRRQRHRARAQLRLRAGPAGAGRVRRRHPASGTGSVRHQR